MARDRLLSAITYLSKLVCEQTRWLHGIARCVDDVDHKRLLVAAAEVLRTTAESVEADARGFRAGDQFALDPYLPFHWSTATTDERRCVRRFLKRPPGARLTFAQAAGPLSQKRARALLDDLIERGVVEVVRTRAGDIRYRLIEVPPGIESVDDFPTATHSGWIDRLAAAPVS